MQPFESICEYLVSVLSISLFILFILYYPRIWNITVFISSMQCRGDGILFFCKTVILIEKITNNNDQSRSVFVKVLILSLSFILGIQISWSINKHKCEMVEQFDFLIWLPSRLADNNENESNMHLYAR